MNLLIYDRQDDWVAAIVTCWIARLRANPHLRMCMTSGNTPLRAYAAMAKAVNEGQASFREAEIFSLDEYGGLAVDDEGRCANMIRKYLVDSVDLPKDKFHQLDPDIKDLDKMCQDYEAKIGNGFDLTILGIGLNGHLGLNEPGSTTDSLTRRAAMAESSIKSSVQYLKHNNLPTWGLTVGMSRLLGSKEVWLLSCGESKASIIERVIKGEVSNDVPASWLKTHKNASLFMDAGSAKKLLS